MEIEKIVAYLQRQLRAAGADRWPAIERATGCSVSLMRKIACGDRRNPQVNTIEPLIAFFLAVDRGEKELPRRAAPKPTTKAA